MVVIANYFFDSIPQEAFFVQGGQLQEGLVTVSSYQQEPDLNDPEILSRAEISYTRNPVETDYYENPDWNEILEYYKSRLDDTAFLFPCAALQCIENFRRISGGRLLVVDGLSPGGDVRQIGPTEPGSYWRPDLSFDGKRVGFHVADDEFETRGIDDVSALEKAQAIYAAGSH